MGNPFLSYVFLGFLTSLRVGDISSLVNYLAVKTTHRPLSWNAVWIEPSFKTYIRSRQIILLLVFLFNIARLSVFVLLSVGNNFGRNVRLYLCAFLFHRAPQLCFVFSRFYTSVPTVFHSIFYVALKLVFTFKIGKYPTVNCIGRIGVLTWDQTQ